MSTVFVDLTKSNEVKFSNVLEYLPLNAFCLHNHADIEIPFYEWLKQQERRFKKTFRGSCLGGGIYQIRTIEVREESARSEKRMNS